MVKNHHHNYIPFLKDNLGNRLLDHKYIKHVFLPYFKTIFSKSQRDWCNTIQKIIESISWVVRQEQKVSLLYDVTLEEVEQVIMDIVMKISTNINGITTNFLHSY